MNNYYLECGCIGHKDCLEAYVINCIKERIINMICPLCKKDILSSNIIYQVLNISRNKEIKEQYQSLLPQKKKKENTIPCPNPKCNYAEYKGIKVYLDPRAEVFLKKNNKKKDILVEYYKLQSRQIDIDKLKEKLNEKKITYRKLAKMTGISYTHLSLIFAHKRNLSVVKLNIILNATGIDVKDITN